MEILSYGFMVRALLAGLLVAVSIPVMGSFLVAKRYSLIADSLAHVSLAGVGLGLLLHTSPVATAIPVAAIGAILLEWLRQRQQISGETSLAILMSGGLALAVVLAGLAQGVAIDFNTYLFGSIVTTQWSDVYTLAIASLVILLIIWRNYQGFLYTAFDEIGAKVSGYNVSLLSYVLAIMTAVMVVLSLRIVGGLLIGALLVIPVMTASQFSRSFSQTIILSIIFSIASVVIGLILAFYLGLAAGGSIVLSALTFFILALLLKK